MADYLDPDDFADPSEDPDEFAQVDPDPDELDPDPEPDDDDKERDRDRDRDRDDGDDDDIDPDDFDEPSEDPDEFAQASDKAPSDTNKRDDGDDTSSREELDPDDFDEPSEDPDEFAQASDKAPSDTNKRDGDRLNPDDFDSPSEDPDEFAQASGAVPGSIGGQVDANRGIESRREQARIYGADTPEGQAQREVAQRADERFEDVGIGVGDVMIVDGTAQLTGSAQRRIGASQLDEQVQGEDIEPTDVTVEDGEVGLTEQAQREIAADRLDEDVKPLDVGPEDVVVEGDEVRLNDERRDELQDLRESQLKELLRDPDEFAQVPASDADASQLIDERDIIRPEAGDRERVFDRRALEDGATATQEVLAEQRIEQQLESQTESNLEPEEDFTVEETAEGFRGELTETGQQTVLEQRGVGDIEPTLVPQEQVFSEVADDAGLITRARTRVRDLQAFQQRADRRGVSNLQIIEQATRSTAADIGDVLRDVQVTGSATEPAPTRGSGTTIGDIESGVSEAVGEATAFASRVRVTGGATTPRPVRERGEEPQDAGGAAATTTAVGTVSNPVLAGAAILAGAAAVASQSEIEVPDEPVGVDESAELEVPDEQSGTREIEVPMEPGDRVSAGELGLPEDAFEAGDSGEIPVNVNRDDVVIQDGEIELPAEATRVAAGTRFEDEEEEEEEEDEEEEEEEETVVVEVPEEMIPDETVVIGEGAEEAPADEETTTSEEEAGEETEEEDVLEELTQQEGVNAEEDEPLFDRGAFDERVFQREQTTTPADTGGETRSDESFDSIIGGGASAPIPAGILVDRLSDAGTASGPDASAPSAAGPADRDLSAEISASATAPIQDATLDAASALDLSQSLQLDSQFTPTTTQTTTIETETFIEEEFTETTTTGTPGDPFEPPPPKRMDLPDDDGDEPFDFDELGAFERRFEFGVASEEVVLEGDDDELDPIDDGLSL